MPSVPLNLTETGLAWSALSALVSGPVKPECLAAAAARGCRLAQSLVTSAPVPAMATSVRDGWAVCAADTAGASPYSPVPLVTAFWIEAGDPMPAGTDAVLELFDIDCVSPHRAALRGALEGEGLRARGEDAPTNLIWRQQGDRFRTVDLLLLAASGVRTVSVRRPKVSLLPVGDEFVSNSDCETLGLFVSQLVQHEGAVLRAFTPVGDEPDLIAAGLLAGIKGADIVLMLGGTGDGRRDQASAGLAAAGHLVLHGLGARPGRTAGFGTVEGCPVIMVPGRTEDALAAWLLLVRPLLRRLSAASAETPQRVRLSRKITSAVGMTELVLLRRSSEPDFADPLATGSLPLAALAQADAVLVVPHGSEGYEPGGWVEVLEMPQANRSSI